MATKTDAQLSEMIDDGGSLAGQARAAAAVGEFDHAYELLAEVDARGLLTSADLPLLGEVAYAAGHLDTTIEAWERAHADALRRGDEVGAAGAAVRVALHLLFDTALMAPVRGWLARAERLLEGLEPTGAQAWFAVVRSYERLLSGDIEAAAPWARKAIEAGTRLEPAAAALGRVAEARCMILTGKVREGLAALDEAGIAMLSGEIDPVTTGAVYCEVICALQALAQFDLAEEWTLAMERWARVSAVGSMHGRCRVHRAEILRLRGACREAEEEAIGACEELRPYLRRELGWPLTELGRIRLQRGDHAGAEEAFRAAHECGWDPQPGRARVQLAHGELPAAAAAIREALDHPSTVPSKELPPNTELRRAPLLEAQVEVEIAAGDLARARIAADELEQIANRFESKALVASATAARARVCLAEGAPTAASERFAAAAQRWNEIGAPYEAACARLGLAEARRAEGNEQLAKLEEETARATLARIAGALPAPPGPAVAVAASSGDAFRCEGDTWCLTFAARSVRLRDRKGLRYLARLLAEPDRELHVLALAGVERGGETRVAALGVGELGVSGGGDAGPLLDGRAKEAYRRRLAEIEDDIAEASAMADLGRREQAETEREFLVRELSRAVGLGGRDRRAGAASERARTSVTRAVRQALACIREHHEPLAEHLERTVRTGTYCSYRPDPRAPVAWNF